MTTTQPVRTFQAGEKIFISHGVYQGTIGHFVALRPDTQWAEVHEDTKGITLTHPVQWLRHCPEGELVWSELLGQPE